jgi:hypothetical protein
MAADGVAFPDVNLSRRQLAFWNARFGVDLIRNRGQISPDGSIERGFCARLDVLAPHAP